MILTMKNLISVLFLFSSLCCIGSKKDSKSHYSQFILSIANGMSQQFFDGPGHKPTTVFVQNNYSLTNSNYLRTQFTPLYALHLQVINSLGISRLIRIETGIGYIIISNLQQNSFRIYTSSGTDQGSFNFYSYTGSVTLPVHIKLCKTIPHGYFTCTLGPDFVLPVHGFQRETENYSNATSLPDRSEHERFNTRTTSHMSTLGMYLKLGYERRMSNCIVNIGPALDFFDLAAFHNNDLLYSGSGYRPYQYYAGIDLAFNFNSTFMVITKSKKYIF